MRASNAEEMALDPVGRYVAGNGWAHFCASPSFWGVLLWGRPNHDDAVALGRTLVLELGAPAVPHVSIVDAARIEGIDAGAFEALDGYVRANMGSLGRQVTRLALVRPPGMEGAFVAGFFEVLPKPYPVGVFESTDAGLSWLDQAAMGPGRPSEHAAELASIHERVTGVPVLVVRLRGLFADKLEGFGVAEAARALGMSERTLQRRLSEAGTTFHDELGAARLGAAQRLMLDSDAPLTTIALEVGCASLQHFSALFRKLTGVSPSAWRERQRTK